MVGTNDAWFGLTTHPPLLPAETLWHLLHSQAAESLPTEVRGRVHSKECLAPKKRPEMLLKPCSELWIHTRPSSGSKTRLLILAPPCPHTRCEVQS